MELVDKKETNICNNNLFLTTNDTFLVINASQSRNASLTKHSESQFKILITALLQDFYYHYQVITLYFMEPEQRCNYWKCSSKIPCYCIKYWAIQQSALLVLQLYYPDITVYVARRGYVIWHISSILMSLSYLISPICRNAFANVRPVSLKLMSYK